MAPPDPEPIEDDPKQAEPKVDAKAEGKAEEAEKAAEDVAAKLGDFA